MVHFGRLLPEQLCVHLGEVLVHVGQSDVGGGVAVGSPLASGVGFGLDVGVALGVGANVEWG